MSRSLLLVVLVCACVVAEVLAMEEPDNLEVEEDDEEYFNKRPRADYYGTPRTIPTRGEPWPKPQSLVNHGGRYMLVRPSTFTFKVSGSDCDLLREALNRYFLLISGHVRAQQLSPHHRYQRDFKGYLDTLEIDLQAPCETYPYLDMNEAYELRIDSPDLGGAGRLNSSSVWGILRGLETFSQLLHLDHDSSALVINSSSTVDFPRFRHRGLLLDTSRHFFPVSDILKTLEAMEYNKMNVFHWHIVDDSSFPFQSATFPELSDKGAYHPLLEVYTHQNVKKVVEFARLRGIRVIPEFDTPGHVFSWSAIPDLLTQCYTGDKPNGQVGPINPINDSVYTFIRALFAEIIELFPEKYFHLGGDEVSFDCWKTNPDITAFMKARNISGNYTALEEMYIQQAVDIATSLNASSVVWQEVFDNGVNIQPDTVVHIWTLNQAKELAKVTAKGYKALLSTCWYLSDLSPGGDWKKFYKCEPHDFKGTEEQKELVMGGEVCMWSEFVDTSNLESRVWPRASAVAERLWSSIDVTDQDEASRRLEEHWCRMKGRGIAAQPANGPGTCAVL